MTRIIRFNPLLDIDLYPQLFRRIAEMCLEAMPYRDPALFAMRMLAQAGRENVFVAAREDGGTITAHALATIETDGLRSWCFVWQMKADDGHVRRIIKQLLPSFREWMSSFGANRIVMASSREEAFARAYGFRKLSGLMEIRFDVD